MLVEILSVVIDLSVIYLINTYKTRRLLSETTSSEATSYATDDLGREIVELFYWIYYDDI